MEHMKMTPSKGPYRCEAMSPDSPLHKTPHKQDESRNIHMAYQNSMGGISLFPNHITPPSGLTKFIARNPFDADLTNRLHLSVISPTIFTKVPTKSPDSPAFSWTIDELAMISPAKIDEFPIQSSHCSDPEIEICAQKAIDKFFSESQIHPSPWNTNKERMKPLVMLTPSRPVEALSTSRESQKTSRDCWTQTVLTLPPELPKSVEDALKPYFTFNQDQNVESEDANSSNNSLRRKLFFNHDESTEDENELSFNLSPIKCQSSPPQSGMCAHGTPLSRSSRNLQRHHGTPNIHYGNLSPPNMSPISNTTNNMSCQSIKSRRGSATRLDFTTFMSIDVSSSEEKESNSSKSTNEQGEEEEKVENQENSNSNNTVEMVSLLQEVTPIKQIRAVDTERGGKLKNAADWRNCVSNENESVNGNNTLVGCSERSSAFQSHDTGYQTCSINNTTDNHCLTPIKKTSHWDKNFSGATKTEEIRISDWQENIKNMFSSTPSKYTRLRDNSFKN